LTSEERLDAVRIQLPDGFDVDEISGPFRLDSPYGDYQASWKVTGKGLVFEQTLRVKALTIPPLGVQGAA